MWAENSKKLTVGYTWFKCRPYIYTEPPLSSLCSQTSWHKMVLGHQRIRWWLQTLYVLYSSIIIDDFYNSFGPDDVIRNGWWVFIISWHFEVWCFVVCFICRPALMCLLKRVWYLAFIVEAPLHNGTVSDRERSIVQHNYLFPVIVILTNLSVCHFKWVIPSILESAKLTLIIYFVAKTTGIASPGKPQHSAFRKNVLLV